ncbi:hypothetical protein [Colwellia sp. TT2012]|uniref:hypothetical protein n=1 Tax=Colwellia sp. TT2012 TaxID=1720342 RepID=UPI0007108D1C|nr:hypothetical protein [Colwellia sp. TT2012]
MSPPDPLSTLVTVFEYWRSNRNGRQVPTPVILREQAIALLNHYSSSQITSALKISGRQLKQWRKCVASTETKPQFVHLPISTSPTQSSVKVERCFASGDQMNLSGAVNAELLISLIGAM